MWLAVEKKVMDAIGKCKGREGEMKEGKKERDFRERHREREERTVERSCTIYLLHHNAI